MIGVGRGLLMDRRTTPFGLRGELRLGPAFLRYTTVLTPSPAPAAGGSAAGVLPTMGGAILSVDPGWTQVFRFLAEPAFALGASQGSPAHPRNCRARDGKAYRFRHDHPIGARPREWRLLGCLGSLKQRAAPGKKTLETPRRYGMAPALGRSATSSDPRVTSSRSRFKSISRSFVRCRASSDVIPPDPIRWQVA